MPLRHIAILVSFLLLLGACNLHKREDAMKLSNELTQVNDSLNYFGHEWGDEFKIAVNTKDFSHLAPLRQNIAEYISRKTIHITTMKDVGCSKPFRESVLDILKFEEQKVLPTLATFEQFTSATSDDEIKNAFNLMISTTQEDMDKHNIMFKHLDDYAVKNDFPKPLDK